MIVEIVVTTPDEAALAERSGADRLEICSALAVGGLTPSRGLVEECRAVTSLPLVVMIRSRPGGFAYSESEFATLLRDVDHCLAAGADDLVLGLLTNVGEVDRERLGEVLARAQGRGVVFHRAFDVVPEPEAALETLVEAGVRRLLTSGCAPTAALGAAVLQRLARCAAGRIELLPAGGIRSGNVAELIAATGVDQVHAAPRRPGNEVANPTYGAMDTIDADEVAALASAARNAAT